MYFAVTFRSCEYHICDMNKYIVSVSDTHLQLVIYLFGKMCILIEISLQLIHETLLFRNDKR